MNFYKIFLLLLTLAMMISCGSDDDNIITDNGGVPTPKIFQQVPGAKKVTKEEFDKVINSYTNTHQEKRVGFEFTISTKFEDTNYDGEKCLRNKLVKRKITDFDKHNLYYRTISRSQTQSNCKGSVSNTEVLSPSHKKGQIKKLEDVYNLSKILERRRIDLKVKIEDISYFIGKNGMVAIRMVKNSQSSGELSSEQSIKNGNYSVDTQHELLIYLDLKLTMIGNPFKEEMSSENIVRINKSGQAEEVKNLLTKTVIEKTINNKGILYTQAKGLAVTDFIQSPIEIEEKEIIDILKAEKNKTSLTKFIEGQVFEENVVKIKRDNKDCLEDHLIEYINKEESETHYIIEKKESITRSKACKEESEVKIPKRIKISIDEVQNLNFIRDLVEKLRGNVSLNTPKFYVDSNEVVPSKILIYGKFLNYENELEEKFELIDLSQFSFFAAKKSAYLVEKRISTKKQMIRKN